MAEVEERVPGREVLMEIRAPQEMQELHPQEFLKLFRAALPEMVARVEQVALPAHLALRVIRVITIVFVLVLQIGSLPPPGLADREDLPAERQEHLGAHQVKTPLMPGEAVEAPVFVIAEPLVLVVGRVGIPVAVQEDRLLLLPPEAPETPLILVAQEEAEAVEGVLKDIG